MVQNLICCESCRRKLRVYPSYITNDIHAFFEKQIRQDCQGTDISDEAIGQYVHEKIIRFSKTNTVFGRIVDEDMDKLDQLNKRTVINKISFQ